MVLRTILINDLRMISVNLDQQTDNKPQAMLCTWQPYVVAPPISHG